MIGRILTRLVDAQAGWARPFGDFNHRWLSALFRPIRPVKDLLHGRWLGHPVHSATTDVPIGALAVVIVLELAGQHQGADLALVVVLLGMVASLVTGLADYSETDGTARTRATVHGTVMVVSYVLLVVSFALRAGGAADRTLPAILALVAFGTISLGAAIGGDLVYLIGTHVNRHAWRGAGAKWVRLELGDLPDIPEGGPTRLRAGINDLAVIREGERILAVHAQCAHAGGPLPDGAIVGDAIECPWHGSRFRLADGHVVRGPAMYDQPAYEVRRAESGSGWEVRRRGA
jgi:nitrite reductase/ring-hydroxylating ferredoxin subunit/uncharacterized membrane protein